MLLRYVRHQLYSGDRLSLIVIAEPKGCMISEHHTLHPLFVARQHTLPGSTADPHYMDKHLQVVQLCAPWLSPKCACLLKCTCRDLNAMRVSWAAHKCIAFELDGSPTAIAWLHKNIVSMRRLSLEVAFSPPKQLLQGLIADGR
jgi:hypothetical protein